MMLFDWKSLYVEHCITIEGTRTSFNGINVKRFTPEA
jgi:hypothetical protein